MLLLTIIERLGRKRRDTRISDPPPFEGCYSSSELMIHMSFASPAESGIIIPLSVLLVRRARISILPSVVSFDFGLPGGLRFVRGFGVASLSLAGISIIFDFVVFPLVARDLLGVDF